MTVSRPFRRHGFGRAMLAALEAMLAGEGITELCLNVCESNLPAKALYAATGYLPTVQHPTMRTLQKHLTGAPLTPTSPGLAI
jgi:GNAT superfamily N-acetyltransferase